MNKNGLIIILGILIAPVIALLVHWIEPELSWGMDFTIGLLCSIVALQIEHLIRIDNTLDKRRKYENFWLTLEKNTWLKESIEAIITAFDKTSNKTSNDFFKQTFQHEIESTKNRLVNIGNGKIETNSFDDIIPTVRAWDTAKKVIRAISVSGIDGADWWQSPQGKNYTKNNIEAVNRKVAVERIFIYNNQVGTELQAIMEEQKEAGINVYKIEKSRLTPDLRIDFVIFDNEFCYEAKISADGVPISNIFSVDKQDILSKVKGFEIMKNLSEKL